MSIEDKFNSLVSLWKTYNKVSELLTKAMGGTEAEEFAKRLVAKYYDAEPLTISNKNADLKTSDNKLIQVKSRKVDIITAIPLGVIRNWDFDILVVILFSKNCDILKAIAINSENAKNILKWDNYQRGYILTTSKDLLQNKNSIDITRNLQKLIDGHSQIEKILEQINSKDELNNIVESTKPNDNYREGQEIKKVKRRIHGWLMKKEQNNSKILYAFIKLYENNNGIVTYEKLEKETGIKKFESNFNQMKNFGSQNNGKIFEQKGKYVYFWEKIKDIIWDAYGRCCKDYGQNISSLPSKNLVQISTKQVEEVKIISKIPTPQTKISFNRILSKREAIDIINRKYSPYLNASNTTFSNINNSKPVWWFEPNNDRFNYDIHLLLNDQNRKILYYFFIKNGSIKNPEILFRQRDNRSHIEIRVGDWNFTDILGKGFRFKEYLKDEIKY